MTRTACVVLTLLFMGMYDILTAGVHKDRDTIYYDDAAFTSTKTLGKLCVELIPSKPLTKLELKNVDQREEQIRLFFIQHNAPAAKYAKLFVEVADENNIDWRLLPTFAFIESGGGKSYRGNNIFGWDSGKAHFKSIEEGIRLIGRFLTLGHYKEKTTQQKICVYNVHARYHRLADKVMNLISTTLT